MNSNLRLTPCVIVGMALSAQFGFATGLPAPMPEFLCHEELAKPPTVLKSVASTSQTPSVLDTQFFTGRPFDRTSKTYIFKYRNYQPEISRWTQIDPIGFPDGPNNLRYAPNPCSEFDFQGLVVVTGIEPYSVPITSILRPYLGLNYLKYPLSSLLADAAHNLDIRVKINAEGSPTGEREGVRPPTISSPAASLLDQVEDGANVSIVGIGTFKFAWEVIASPPILYDSVLLPPSPSRSPQTRYSYYQVDLILKVKREFLGSLETYNIDIPNDPLVEVKHTD